jgi:hypothetical protein
MLNKKVFELQSEFLRRLSSSHDSPQECCVSSFLHFILECDDDLLDFSLGKLGQKLSMFAKNVDFKHPGVADTFNSLINNNQDFAQECIELLTLAQYAKNKNLKRIIPFLGQLIAKNLFDENLTKKIDVLSNKMYVRLLKDSKEREEIRMTKRMQTIDLRSFYKKDEDVWNSQPDNFSNFLRFNTSYQDDIKLAEKKAIRYEELGCDSLASEIRKSIALFYDNIDQSYYGFNRITITNISLVLAKSLGYNYTASEEASYSRFMSYGNWKTESKITVDRSFFGKYNFDPEQIIEFSPIISSLTKSKIFTKKNQISYNYEPRIYPIHELSDIMTDSVRNIIYTLENFPEAGYKPIFDHFGVIVPGVEFPMKDDSTNTNKMYSFSDERGIIHSYSIRETALKALDSILIKGEYLYGILVGEKDSKCYFISYFL